ncbi:MAG TPA: fluoride efflux transporter CrcB [Pirellulaceae bacterium]
MTRYLIVGLGGFAGSVVRYMIGAACHRFASESAFPWSTLVVNALGCFAIGWLMELADRGQNWSADLRAFVFVGVLGGFTTFSAFGQDSYALWRHGAAGWSMVNVVLHLAWGLGAVWLGHAIGGYTAPR